MGKINFSGIMNITKGFIMKHSPEILIGAGIVGMFTTTIIAVKNTPKAIKRIEEAEEEKGEELTKFEIVKTVTPLYIAPAITAAVSTACIIGASNINHKRNAALATAYAISEAALTEYKDKVIETIGEKKEHEIQDSIDRDIVERNPVHQSEVFITEKGNTLCYDVTSGRYFRSDIDKIKTAIHELNFQMMDDMWVSLNDFYSAIGLRETSTGEILGWSISKGPIKPRFSSQLSEDGEPCLVIKYNINPAYDYRDR